MWSKKTPLRTQKDPTDTPKFSQGTPKGDGMGSLIISFLNFNDCHYRQRKPWLAFGIWIYGCIWIFVFGYLDAFGYFVLAIWQEAFVHNIDSHFSCSCSKRQDMQKSWSATLGGPDLIPAPALIVILLFYVLNFPIYCFRQSSHKPLRVLISHFSSYYVSHCYNIYITQSTYCIMLPTLSFGS